MKRAIVIGATSGIGKEISKLLAEDNYRVGITGRRTELLEEIRKLKPEFYITKTFDIREYENIEENLETLVKSLGGLDLVVISSGTGKVSEKLDFEIEENTILTNSLGFTRIADWAMSYFENQKYGHLVGISSIAGLRGNRFSPAYAATKAFQINYLEGLRHRAAHLKLPIFVTDIRPGFVDTAMAQGDKIFWLVPVEKAGKQIFKAIKRKRKVVYVSKKWTFFAWFMKILPRWIHQKI
ncbi:Short-chain dehydrogenase/reductase SDR [uncultured Paludibacter sp.]|nr:Short-chain dehydrogenase/reductase SDR [uncultured Paludibacter sp.]